ncbi:hypothetical protein HPB50_007837 [Hyalomma asiaticum]|uniref:Uncharacterized protein n=1 Tax=Hyalomma asiaticum TaxID=266040 RepID=A0ACB7TE71_HYAAI|nr:hypothetical protein HPB50_007837 [Hyalomma asiaticum]
MRPPRLQREASATLTPSGIRPPPRGGFPRTLGRERLRAPRDGAPAAAANGGGPSSFRKFSQLEPTSPAQSTRRLRTAAITPVPGCGGRRQRPPDPSAEQRDMLLADCPSGADVPNSI